jgi:hypothetical protein
MYSDSDTTNTLIESFNKTLLDFMDHLNNHTPPEVAGFASDSKSKYCWFVAA